MEIIKSEDVYYVEDYDYVTSNEILLGVIRKDEEGYWVFAPHRKITMTVRQLRDLSKYISEMNKKFN